jgi:hypothetical protein
MINAVLADDLAGGEGTTAGRTAPRPCRRAVEPDGDGAARRARPSLWLPEDHHRGHLGGGGQPCG